MLTRLLNLLREGGTRCLSDLARELGTTPELIETMLEDLGRMGYVKRVDGHCSQACSSCPMSDLCAAGAPSHKRGGQVWVLTEEQEPA